MRVTLPPGQVDRHLGVGVGDRGGVGIGRLLDGVFATAHRVALLGRFVADHLAVTEPEQLLVDPDVVRAPPELGHRQVRTLGQQLLGVDDDLPLTAEVVGHPVDREPVECRIHHVGGIGDADEERRRAAVIRLGPAGVEGLRGEIELIPRPHAERGEVELGAEQQPGAARLPVREGEGVLPEADPFA